MALNLRDRDKQALIIAGSVMILFLVFQFILLPLTEHQKVLQRQVLAAENNLEKIKSLEKEFYLAQTRSELSDNNLFQHTDFNLFSFLEQFAGDTGIKKHIAYMKPSSAEQKGTSLKLNMVEIKFDAVTISELVHFLFRVETSDKKILISRMSINKTSQPEGFINAVVQVETLAGL